MAAWGPSVCAVLPLWACCSEKRAHLHEPSEPSSDRALIKHLSPQHAVQHITPHYTTVESLPAHSTTAEDLPPHTSHSITGKPHVLHRSTGAASCSCLLHRTTGASSCSYCKEKGTYLLWLMHQSVFIPVKCSNEARRTYSGFSGADLNNKHLQL